MTLKNFFKKFFALMLFAVVAVALVACDGCGGKKEFEVPVDENPVYTYNDYTAVSPSNWNELTYQDNNDTQIMSYISGSFFNYDFKRDANGNILPGEFEVEYDAEIGKTLRTLGINKAFLDTAEFHSMFDHGTMSIDRIKHKTYIKVDEKGTEAAAVTAIGMAGSALPPKPLILKYNKPFTFVIRDDNKGEILFIGEYAFCQ